jgi:ribonuclease R
VIGIGQRVLVRLAEAVPVTGGLVLELLEIEGNAMPGGAARAKGRAGARMPGRARAKAAKTGRKVERKRRSRD